MSEIMNMEFLNNKYVSNTVLSGIPEKGEWTLNGFKLAYLIACEMSDYRIFIKKDSEINSFDNDKIQDHLETVPKSYNISRDRFQEITGVSYANVAREISKSCDDLLSKIITLPNPFELDNRKSFEKVQWFSKARYDDDKANITIDIHADMLPYFVVLVNYTKLDYRNIARLKNLYSARVYLICKIAQNKFNSDLQIKISIDELKSRIGLDGKYDNLPRLRSRVLDVVTDEINKKTDLNFCYELHKQGKRYTDITLKFSQKVSAKKNDMRKQQPQKKIEHQPVEEPITTNPDDQTLIISAHLQSYGISKKKSLEYVSNYGAATCKLGIEKLLNEIQKGRKIKNISGYLVSCIENEANTTNADEVKAVMDSVDDIKDKAYSKKIELLEGFDEYINNNDQDILILLARHEAQTKLVDDYEINMLDCLKDVLDQYSGLENSDLILKLQFKGDMLNYDMIKKVVNELEVASNEERIVKLKAELAAKKLELDAANEGAKGLVEKEINMLKVAIADLV